MRHRIKNQQNPPVKGGPSDEVWKLYFKTPDGASIPLFKNLPRWKANHKKEVLLKLYGDWAGHLFVSK